MKEEKLNNLQNIEDSNDKLPKGWSKTTLSDVSDIIFGQSPPSSTYNNQGIGYPFFQGKAEFGKLYPIEKKWCNQPKRIAKSGDILMSIRAPVGPTNIAIKDCAIGRGLAAIKPILICKKFTQFYLKLFENEISVKGTGTTFSSITKNTLSNQEILIAPINEQKRIVDKIEQLFSDLDKGEDLIKTIQKQLKTYRQSVLQSAITGELTKDWRKNNSNIESAEDLLIKIINQNEVNFEEELRRWQSGEISKKPKKIDLSYFETPTPTYKIPDSWKYCKIKDLISHLTDYHANGSYQSLKNNVVLKDNQDYAIMIRATNFEKQDFQQDLKYVSKSSYDFLSKSKLYGGEILIGKIGNAGRIYLMPNLNKPASLAMNLFCLRFNLIDSKYIYYHLSSSYSKLEIKQYIKGVGNPTIDKKSIRSINIFLPPLEEQKQIVQKVDRIFSQIDSLEKWCNEALIESKSLRQSILKSAFSGQLVPQDPNDEPASKLLEKIKEVKR